MFPLTKNQIRLALFILVVCLLAAGCGKHTDADDEGASVTAVPDVTVVKVQRAMIAEDLTVSGNLAALPNRDAKISAQVPGRIAEILVNEGDSVAAGQILARIDNTPLLDQQRQAEAAVAQAKANVENAQLATQRSEDLLRRGIAARKEAEDARTQLAVNLAAMRQAEAAFAAAHTQASRATVRSPFSGTVVHRFLGTGEQVEGTGAQPIVEIANIDTLELLGSVPAAKLSQLKVGQRFTFETTSVPGKNFTGNVLAVLPAVDPSTNTGTVRIRVENSGHELKLGMFVTVHLPLRQNGARLVVPKGAVYPDESGEPHVYKVTGDEAQSVAIELGVQTKDQVEIMSGINEGDFVILQGGYGLPEKAKVHVK